VLQRATTVYCSTSETTRRAETTSFNPGRKRSSPGPSVGSCPLQCSLKEEWTMDWRHCIKQFDHHNSQDLTRAYSKGSGGGFDRYQSSYNNIVLAMASVPAVSRSDDTTGPLGLRPTRNKCADQLLHCPLVSPVFWRPRSDVLFPAAWDVKTVVISAKSATSSPSSLWPREFNSKFRGSLPVLKRSIPYTCGARCTNTTQ
jgi:hypothetical protein